MIEKKKHRPDVANQFAIPTYKLVFDEEGYPSELNAIPGMRKIEIGSFIVAMGLAINPPDEGMSDGDLAERAISIASEICARLDQ